MKGKWEAVELDPTLFSEEGLEGLVCFEELKDYRLIDSEKAAAKAANELKREKKKTKKRKASEGEEAGEKVDIESKEGAQTAEPAKKKAKNKKKNNKPTAKESDQPDNTSVEVTQKDVVAAEEAGGNKTPKEDASKDTAIISEPDAQSKPTKKSKKKKKKIKQQIKKDEIPETQPNQESPSELQALEKEKSTQDKLIKAPQNKKLMKNWTNAAHSGSYDKNADVSAWKDLFVPSPVLKALSSLGFSSPSPIQALALPPAIRDRMDVLGAAETGKIKYPLFLSHNNMSSCFH